MNYALSLQGQLKTETQIKEGFVIATSFQTTDKEQNAADYCYPP